MLLMILLVDYFYSSHSVAVWIFLGVVAIPLGVVRCPHRSQHQHHPHLPVDHHRILTLTLLLLLLWVVESWYVHERMDVVDEY